ncbi:MAG: PASTA domain-containing protein [Oscillochloris sp.]|nr:PASTA domain-containing protein [Oscillochloris sp.]
MSPANGATISSASQTGFEAVAWNPQVGTNNGAGIQKVTLQVLGPGGQSISNQQESVVSYCAHGGDSPCAPISNSTFQNLPAGTYTIIAQAFAADGRTATDTHTFVIVSPATPTATPSPTSTATPTATAVPMCQVPNVVGQKYETAKNTWSGRGFTTNLVKGSSGGNYTIKSQSLGANSMVPCSTTMKVYR